MLLVGLSTRWRKGKIGGNGDIEMKRNIKLVMEKQFRNKEHDVIRGKPNSDYEEDNGTREEKRRKWGWSSEGVRT